jgi:hypothetical protein
VLLPTVILAYLMQNALCYSQWTDTGVLRSSVSWHPSGIVAAHMLLQDDPNERFEAFTLKHENGNGGVTMKFLQIQARIPAGFLGFRLGGDRS